MSRTDELYDEAMSDAGFIQTLEDPEKLEKLERALHQAVGSPRETVGFSQAERAGERTLAVLIKRTYKIHNARCEYAGDEEQEALMRAEMPYDREVEPPKSSPPFFSRDYTAVRRETDVIIQALACAYQPDTRKTEVSVRFAGIERRIAVFGPRVGTYDHLGRPRFSEPLPFQAVPLRYDYAYGGVDLHALLAEYAHLPDDAEVDLPVFSEHHYPRNPAGLGYLIELTRERFEGMLIPLLEDPDSPLSPERLAVGKPERWPLAPLPACWDWVSEGWFPRIGYLGLTPDVEDREMMLPEVKKGWVAPDILSIPAVHEEPDNPPRVEFARAASPGMTVAELPPDTTFELRGLHPFKQLYSFSMPGEVPEVQLELSPGVLTSLEPHLDSVVVRPDPGQLVVVWSARAKVDRRYEARELYLMRRKLSFRAARKGAS